MESLQIMGDKTGPYFFFTKLKPLSCIISDSNFCFWSSFTFILALLGDFSPILESENAETSGAIVVTALKAAQRT